MAEWVKTEIENAQVRGIKMVPPKVKDIDAGKSSKSRHLGRCATISGYSNLAQSGKREDHDNPGNVDPLPALEDSSESTESPGEPVAPFGKMSKDVSRLAQLNKSWTPIFAYGKTDTHRLVLSMSRIMVENSNPGPMVSSVIGNKRKEVHELKRNNTDLAHRPMASATLVSSAALLEPVSATVDSKSIVGEPAPKVQKDASELLPDLLLFGSEAFLHASQGQLQMTLTNSVQPAQVPSQKPSHPSLSISSTSATESSARTLARRSSAPYSIEDGHDKALVLMTAQPSTNIEADGSNESTNASTAVAIPSSVELGIAPVIPKRRNLLKLHGAYPRKSSAPTHSVVVADVNSSVETGLSPPKQTTFGWTITLCASFILPAQASSIAKSIWKFSSQLNNFISLSGNEACHRASVRFRDNVRFSGLSNVVIKAAFSSTDPQQEELYSVLPAKAALNKTVAPLEGIEMSSSVATLVDNFCLLLRPRRN
eukprot:Filipodium_phascolosomae@DN850_c0_g1_i2.p1